MFVMSLIAIWIALTSVLRTGCCNADFDLLFLLRVRVDDCFHGLLARRPPGAVLGQVSQLTLKVWAKIALSWRWFLVITREIPGFFAPWVAWLRFLYSSTNVYGRLKFLLLACRLWFTHLKWLVLCWQLRRRLFHLHLLGWWFFDWRCPHSLDLLYGLIRFFPNHSVLLHLEQFAGQHLS